MAVSRQERLELSTARHDILGVTHRIGTLILALHEQTLEHLPPVDDHMLVCCLKPRREVFFLVLCGDDSVQLEFHLIGSTQLVDSLEIVD